MTEPVTMPELADPDVDQASAAESTGPATEPALLPRRDWGWVEAWRASGERPAYTQGVTIAIFVAALVVVSMIVLGQGLSENLFVLVSIDLVIVGGMVPALWLSRSVPVLRFLAAGVAVGLVIGVAVNIASAI